MTYDHLGFDFNLIEGLVNHPSDAPFVLWSFSLEASKVLL